MARLRNRMVNAEFWTDPELLRWPRDKRQTYRGLWAIAEDSGCLEDDPFGWKLILWPSPMDVDITVELLTQWRDELVTARKVIPYEADGKRYLFLRTFHDYEKPRNPQRPSLPLPEWVKWLPDNDNKDRSRGKYEVVTETVAAQYCDVTVFPVQSSPVQSSPPPIVPQTSVTVAKTERRAAVIRGRYDHWRSVYPQETARLTLTNDRSRAISGRLSEGIAPETIDEAVTNTRGDPWWTGAKDGEWKADIKAICGKGSTVENLAARTKIVRHEPQPDARAREKRIAKAKAQLAAGYPDAARAMVFDDEWDEVRAS